jgi:hypothetical protein
LAVYITVSVMHGHTNIKCTLFRHTDHENRFKTGDGRHLATVLDSICLHTYSHIYHYPQNCHTFRSLIG